MSKEEHNKQDIYLIKRVLGGDDEAFAMLVDSYKIKIYQFVYRKIPNKGDVEDLAQEIFLRVYRSLARFDQKRSFSTWIYAIANNLCIDYLRKKRLQAVSLDAPLFPSSEDKAVSLEIPDEAYAPEQVFARTSGQIQVLEAIENLSEEYRLVIKLRHLKGYSYEEIQQVLDLPMGTIKSRIYRARSELKKLLKGNDDEKGGQKNGLSRCI